MTPEIEAMYTDYDTLDITDRDAVGRCLAENKFDFVVNCAAYTAVDRAETDDLKAAALNTGAVGNLGEAAARNGTKVIHISTDYVFSGQGCRPYDEKDEPYPQGIYGRTKLEGEGLLSLLLSGRNDYPHRMALFAIRQNFVKTMMQLADTHDRLTVVCDQIGTPTFCRRPCQGHPHYPAPRPLGARHLPFHGRRSGFMVRFFQSHLRTGRQEC